jgi:hypothetical protein
MVKNEEKNLKLNYTNNFNQYDNLEEILDSIENDKILGDLYVKEKIIQQNKDFTGFNQLKDENISYDYLLAYLKNLSENKNHVNYSNESHNQKNISGLMHSYKSTSSKNKLSLESSYNIEKADIKIDGSPKLIHFKDTENQLNDIEIRTPLEIKKSQNQKNDQKNENINTSLIEEITENVNKNPRITLWSNKSAAVLRYLRKTKPEFSISKESSLLLEKVIKEKYPHIWELFDNLD